MNETWNHSTIFAAGSPTKELDSQWYQYSVPINTALLARETICFCGLNANNLTLFCKKKKKKGGEFHAMRCFSRSKPKLTKKIYSLFMVKKHWDIWALNHIHVKVTHKWFSTGTNGSDQNLPFINFLRNYKILNPADGKQRIK
jgi:hypothetical protein